VLGVGGCRLCIVACLSNCPASSAMVIQRILQAPTRALVAWKAPENVKVAIVVLTIIGLTTMKVMGGEQIVVAPIGKLTLRGLHCDCSLFKLRPQLTRLLRRACPLFCAQERQRRKGTICFHKKNRFCCAGRQSATWP
jgi:hypothetical protein